ncbi:MAG: hypothetical protein DI536_07835 [Archangium gephyra]|uniref:Uncharacterized protein n=1 Tax=Archangium gephyra TaxID=48 RepID=A0A2W5TS53_9BACT|nr:MAG: hypothetical protein DI536_07835 [Archangium gephyra]
MEIVWGGGATGTGSINLANVGTYASCPYCVVLGRTCSDGSCSGGVYLGRAGTLNVTSAARAVGATFAASISNVRFEEWNLNADAPVSGGRCFIVPSAAVNVTTVAGN